ncbi:MAG TPA: hypothetical protein VF529_11360 [Solirubrobacteraceae bacterium]
MLLVLAVLALEAPAYAAPEPETSPGSCEPTGVETTVTARVVETGGATAVVACEVRGRRLRVLREGGLRKGDRHLAAAAAYGRRVAWTETRMKRRVTVGRLVVADGVTGRRITTRVIFRLRGVPEDAEVGVAYTRAGDLAWQLPSRMLVLQRRGRRPRVVAENGVSGGLRVVDDGATLRWIVNGAFHTWLDVVPRPRTCTLRDRFRAIHRTPGVVVSRATFTEGLVETIAYRACAREIGRDPVVFTDVPTANGSTRVSVAAFAGSFLALRLDSHDRDLATSSLASIDLRTGASRAWGVWDWPPRQWVALLPDGSVAWIEQRPNQPGDPILDRLRLGRWNGQYTEYGPEYVELDRGGQDQLADLRAEGSTLRWTNAGQPRSYP